MTIMEPDKKYCVEDFYDSNLEVMLIPPMYIALARTQTLSHI